jgi:hypothetical protein
MQLDTLTTGLGILQNHAPAGDIARPAEWRRGHSLIAGGPEHPQIAVAQVVPTIRDARGGIPQSVEYNERVGRTCRRQHFQLKPIVEPGVHQLEGKPDRCIHRSPDLSGNFTDPAKNLLPLVSQGVSRERG